MKKQEWVGETHMGGDGCMHGRGRGVTAVHSARSEQERDSHYRCCRHSRTGARGAAHTRRRRRLHLGAGDLHVVQQQRAVRRGRNDEMMGSFAETVMCKDEMVEEEADGLAGGGTGEGAYGLVVDGEGEVGLCDVVAVRAVGNDAIDVYGGAWERRRDRIKSLYIDYMPRAPGGARTGKGQLGGYRRFRC